MMTRNAVDAWNLRLFNIISSRERLATLPTFRRTSALVTEWPQNCAHLGKFGGAATLQARTRHREVTDEGDCGDGSGCGNGRGEAGGAARSAGGDKRRRCSDSCVGIHRGWGE